MKTKKTFEIEIQRNNVTPAQFLAYVRSRVDSKGGEMIRSDLSLRYFAAGDDLNFDVHHEEPELYGVHEKSVSHPYEMQTFVHCPNGATYNEICEFDFDDEKTGHGYYYLLNVEAVEDENGAETSEETEAETTTTETAETVEETETTSETAERSESETADGADSTGETTAAEQTGANGRDERERQRRPDNGGGNTLSALSALSANPPFLR